MNFFQIRISTVCCPGGEACGVAQPLMYSFIPSLWALGPLPFSHIFLRLVCVLGGVGLVCFSSTPSSHASWVLNSLSLVVKDFCLTGSLLGVSTEKAKAPSAGKILPRLCTATPSPELNANRSVSGLHCSPWLLVLSLAPDYCLLGKAVNGHSSSDPGSWMDDQQALSEPISRGR